jgi:LmbE family N-acetylglucosaminyl deacetylase
MVQKNSRPPSTHHIPHKELILSNTYIPKRVMAIVAHPDDIEFSCAGTIAKWVQAGAEACYVLCTSGDVGIDKAGTTKAEAAKIREAEQVAAAEAIGVKDVVFLGYPDGMLENTMELRKKLVRELRRFRPEVVITGDPTMIFTPRGGINHPDHRAVSGAAIDAVFPAVSQPNLFQELEEEGLTACRVRKLYITARGEGNIFVDITDTMAAKLNALSKHKSQMSHWDFEEPLKKWAAETAQQIEAQYAEAFRVITLESDERWAEMEANPEAWRLQRD